MFAPSYFPSVHSRMGYENEFGCIDHRRCGTAQPSVHRYGKIRFGQPDSGGRGSFRRGSHHRGAAACGSRQLERQCAEPHPRHDAAFAEHVRRAYRRRGRAHRPSVPCRRMWRLDQNRSHLRHAPSPARRLRNRQSHGNPRQGRLHRPAVHEPRSVCGPRSRECRSRRRHAPRCAHRHEPRPPDQGNGPYPH